MIAADAVLGVHDRVAFAQLRQVAHHGLDVAAVLLGATSTSRAARLAGVEVVFGNQQDRFGNKPKARAKRRDDEGEAAIRLQELLQGFRLCVRANAKFGQHLQQGFASAGGVCTQGDTALVLVQQGAQTSWWVVGAPRDGDVGSGEKIGMIRIARERQTAERLDLIE